jgi:hypothetical protein
MVYRRNNELNMSFPLANILLARSKGHQPQTFFSSDVPGVDIPESYIPYENDIIKKNEIAGLLAFDGVDDSVSFGAIDVTTNAIIKFEAYYGNPDANNYILFDNSVRQVGIVIKSEGGSTYNLLISNTLSNVNNFNVYDVSDYRDEQLGIVVSYSSENISSVVVNNDILSVDSTSSFAYFTLNGGSYLGYNGSAFGDNQYIWGLDITSLHAYVGQPDGNQNSAWEDTTGSIDGTVNGSPTTIDLIL